MTQLPSPLSPPSLPQTLVASWERSRGLGLRRDEPLDHTPLARGEMADRLAANDRLLALSRPMIEGLYRQIDSPSSTVLLADRDGVILSALGHTDFLDRASAIALRPGVDWTEARMGTNAIGTALETGMVTLVQGGQHYLERNGILTCVATPILAPAGGMLGILDLSSDARENLAHAGALLRTTAELIEYRLLDTLDEGFLTLHFHNGCDALADALHAVAVFDEAGWLVASNRRARALLALAPDWPQASYEACFATPWSGLISLAAQQRSAPFALQGVGGRPFIARARLRSPPRRNGTARPAAAPQPDASRLAGADLGDSRLADIVETLRDAAKSTAPLLFEGEMGTGKAYLARAFHADHRASPDAPLVGLDCSTLPAGGAEAQLDHAWSQAADGILFLVDIDALPIPLQAGLFEAGDGTRARVVGVIRRPLAELQHAGRLDLRGFDARGGRILSLPPLRERTDFTALVRQLVREAAPDRPIDVHPEALAVLRRHRWPGNVRELRNQLRLILALMREEAGQLRAEDIPAELLDEIAESQG